MTASTEKETKTEAEKIAAKQTAAGGKRVADQRKEYREALEAERDGYKSRADNETDKDVKAKYDNRAKQVDAQIDAFDKAEKSTAKDGPAGPQTNRGGTGANAERGKSSSQ